MKEASGIRRYTCSDCLLVWSEEIDRYLAEIAALRKQIEQLEEEAHMLRGSPYHDEEEQ